MKKFMLVLMGLVLGGVLGVQAEYRIVGIVNESETGTYSATVYINPGNCNVVQLTDVAWDTDTGNVSGTLNIRTGLNRYAVTSPTSASGTVLWFTNSNTAVAVSAYVLYHDTSADILYLYRVAAATTTSITVYETITPATAVTDYVWSLNTAVSRPVFDRAISGTDHVGDIWLPGREPSALTLDGNTTSCKLSVSGVRLN